MAFLSSISGSLTAGRTVFEKDFSNGIITAGLVVNLNPNTFNRYDTGWTDSQGNASATIYNFSELIYERNKGFKFNGVAIDSYMLLPNNSYTSFNYNDNYTVEVWINASSDHTQNTGVIIRQGREIDSTPPINQNYSYSIEYSKLGSGGISAGISYDTGGGQTGSSSTRDIVEDSWTQVVVTNDGSTGSMDIYINGTYQVTLGSSTDDRSNNSEAVIGRLRGNDGSFSSYFQGQIGIIRIYNSYFSSSDVLQNYNANRIDYRV